MSPEISLNKFRVLADVEVGSGTLRVSFPFEIKPVIVASVAAISKSEQNVLVGMQQGLSHKEIGVKLHISERTSKFHASALFKKFGVQDKIELLRIVGYKPKE